MPKFRDAGHEEFFKTIVCKAKCAGDPYREAFFYTIGITSQTRKHVNDLYDFEEECPKFSNGPKGAWYTKTSAQVVRLAFNLFNGWCESGFWSDASRAYTPYDLFDSPLMPWMFEGIKLAFPQYAGNGRAQEK